MVTHTHYTSTSYPGSFTYARAGGKDPGSGWLRDNPKSGVCRIAASFVTLGGVAEGRENCNTNIFLEEEL